jgi:hypothetical protein
MTLEINNKIRKYLLEQDNFNVKKMKKIIKTQIKRIENEIKNEKEEKLKEEKEKKKKKMEKILEILINYKKIINKYIKKDKQETEITNFTKINTETFSDNKYDSEIINFYLLKQKLYIEIEETLNKLILSNLELIKKRIIKKAIEQTNKKKINNVLDHYVKNNKSIYEFITVNLFSLNNELINNDEKSKIINYLNKNNLNLKDYVKELKDCNKFLIEFNLNQKKLN